MSVLELIVRNVFADVVVYRLSCCFNKTALARYRLTQKEEDGITQYHLNIKQAANFPYETEVTILDYIVLCSNCSPTSFKR